MNVASTRHMIYFKKTLSLTLITKAYVPLIYMLPALYHKNHKQNCYFCANRQNSIR